MTSHAAPSRADVKDIKVGQVWRSRDKRDAGRTVTVEEWDGLRYGFVSVRSVRRSRIRALNFVRQYDLVSPTGSTTAAPTPTPTTDAVVAASYGDDEA